MNHILFDDGVFQFHIKDYQVNNCSMSTGTLHSYQSYMSIPVGGDINCTSSIRRVYIPLTYTRKGVCKITRVYAMK